MTPLASTSTVFTAIYLRDLRLAGRRRTEALLPLAFFVVAASLFPLGVGPEAKVLRQIAPGVVWVCALLATMLSASQVYAGDHADGTLEQWLLPGSSAVTVSVAKAAAHWTLSGVPLVATAPLFGMLFGLPGDATAALCLSLLVGTPVLSLFGGVGAALTLGLRGGGMLLVLLVLPLCVPVLVFGAGAVTAVDLGMSPSGHYSLLGALLIASLALVPAATAAALRISSE